MDPVEIPESRPSAVSAKPKAVPNPWPQFKCELWGLPALLIAGLVMAVISWRRWPDVLVDFGQQVYMAWQLSLGQLLYQDVAHVHGPLSLYVHALLFKLFGPGLMVLVWFNLCLVAALTVVTFHLFRHFADDLTATLACLVFLMIFAFGQYAGGGNYNFITPYAYELPHGILLGFIALLVFFRYLEKPSSMRLMLAGLISGFVLLTKLEVILALLAAIVTGLLLEYEFRRQNLKALALRLADFFIPFCVPYLLFVVYYTTEGGQYDGVFSLLSNWVWMPNDLLASIPLYRWTLGLDQPMVNLQKMAIGFGLYAAVLAALILLSRLVSRLGIEPFALIPCGITVLMAAGITIIQQRVPWLEMMRPLPLLLLAWAAYQGWTWLRQRKGKTISHATRVQIVLGVFSLALLTKVFLNTHVYHFGFALAMPGTLLLVAAMLHNLPRIFLNTRRQFLMYSLPAVALLMIFIGQHFSLSFRLYELKGFPVGQARDMVYDYHTFLTQRGKVIQTALDYIQKTIPESKTVAPIPQGAMMSYMARRTIPVRRISYNPVEAHLFSQEEYLTALKNSPPDYLLLVDTEESVLGERHFGKDYGRDIYAWIRNNYSLLRQIGDRPFQGGDFGIQILIRKIPTRKS